MGGGDASEACLFVTEVGFAMLDSISVQFDCMSCMYFACFGVCSSEIYHKIKLEITFHTRRFSWFSPATQ